MAAGLALGLAAPQAQAAGLGTTVAPGACGADTGTTTAYPGQFVCNVTNMAELYYALTTNSTAPGGAAVTSGTVNIVVSQNITVTQSLYVPGGVTLNLSGQTGSEVLLRGTNMTGAGYGVGYNTPLGSACTTDGWGNQCSILLLNMGGATVTMTNLIMDGNQDNVTANSPLLYTSAAASTWNLNEGVVLRNNFNHRPYSGSVLNTRTSVTGGAFANMDGTLNIADAELTGNTSLQSAGAIWNWGGHVNLISGSINNNSTCQGGGLFQSSGVFTMQGGEMVDNVAKPSPCNSTENGGAVTLLGGSMYLEGGLISRNMTVAAGGRGGGIHMQDANFVMTGGEISNNKAGSYGGGISVQSTSTTASNTFSITGGSIINNEVIDNTISGNNSQFGGSGGGVWILKQNPAAPPVVIGDTAVIAGNKAAANGGGIFFAAKSALEVSGSARITGNEAVGSMNTSLSGLPLQGGGGGGNGGGIFDMSTGTVTIQDQAVISGNTAANDGGGLYAAAVTYLSTTTPAGPIDVTGTVEFTDNAANAPAANDSTTNGSGGGIWVGSRYTSLTVGPNVYFNNNFANQWHLLSPRMYQTYNQQVGGTGSATTFTPMATSVPFQSSGAASGKWNVYYDINTGALLPIPQMTTDETGFQNFAYNNFDINYYSTPQVTLDKTATLVGPDGSTPVLPGNMAAGDKINYAFTVTNTGQDTLYDVTVTDSPDSVGAVFSGTNGFPEITGCTIDTVPVNNDGRVMLYVGKTMLCSAQYTLSQADVNAGDVINTAYATGHSIEGDPTFDSDSANLIGGAAALHAVKSATPATVDHAGQVITYTITLLNTGATPIDSAASGQFETNELAFTGAGTLPVIRFPKTTLQPDESMVGTATYTVTQADIENGLAISNTATVTGEDTQNNPVTSAPSTAIVTVAQNPHLSVVKTASPASGVAENDTVTYTFNVTNDGNVTATDVAVSDPLPGLSAITCEPVAGSTLAPDDTMTCTATYTVTAADAAAGHIDNTATVTGNHSAPNPTPGGPPLSVPIPAGAGSATVTAQQVCNPPPSGNGCHESVPARGWPAIPLLAALGLLALWRAQRQQRRG